MEETPGSGFVVRGGCAGVRNEQRQIAASGLFHGDISGIFSYSIPENLVLWAKSEKIGFAVNECHGILE